MLDAKTRSWFEEQGTQGILELLIEWTLEEFPELSDESIASFSAATPDMVAPVRHRMQEESDDEEKDE